jgi:hypothetical protein
MKQFWKILFLTLPNILLIGISFSSPWFIFWEQNNFILANVICIIGSLLFYFGSTEKVTEKIRNFRIFFLIPIPLVLVGMFLFPIQNLKLGDGIILLENIAIEANNFGYQIILDEMLEGFLHSFLYMQMKMKDPREIYYYVSSITGIILVCMIIGVYRKKFIENPVGLLILPASGGILLFFGYFENYSLVTFWIFLVASLVYIILEKNKTELKPLLLLAIFSAIGCMLHLVYGYTLFSLGFLAYILSDKKKFIYNSIVSGLVAILILVVFFGYFLFFSDLRLDPSQGHATNPRFYPIQKMISINHIKEILSCMLFNSSPAVFSILYIAIFERSVWDNFQKSKYGKYLLFLLGGFLLHGFVHDPQLGFPADWDLMGFYWIPLCIIAIQLIGNMKFEKSIVLIPFLIFNFSIVIGNSIYLNQKDMSLEKSAQKILTQIEEFSSDYKKDAFSIEPKERKFHVRTKFFLYRTEKNLESFLPESKELWEENMALQKEFEAQYPDFRKQWKKDFLFRATRFHERYLEFIQNK